MNKKNVSCKHINWQWFPRLAHAWDVLWYDIVSVDQIAHGKCDCKTVILAIIFYRSLVSESSVTGLGVYTGWWVYDNITPHSLCYLARVRPVLLSIRKVLVEENTFQHSICIMSTTVCGILGVPSQPVRGRSSRYLVVSSQLEFALQWRHNEHHGVSNQWHIDCLLSRFFQAHIKKPIKAPHHGPLWGEYRWILLAKGQ